MKTTSWIWLCAILGAAVGLLPKALDGGIDWTSQYLLAVAAGVLVIGAIGSFLVRAGHRNH